MACTVWLLPVVIGRRCPVGSIHNIFMLLFLSNNMPKTHGHGTARRTDGRIAASHNASTHSVAGA